MNRALIVVWVCGLAVPALAQPQAPELTPPSPELDVPAPVAMIPATRPEIDWPKLMAGYRQRKQVSKEAREAEVVSGDVRRAYDKDGRVIKIEEAESEIMTTTDYSYDAKGRLQRSFVRYAGSGSIGPYTLASDYRYNDAGQIEQMTKQEIDGAKDLGKADSRFEYDAGGRLIMRADGAEKKVVWRLQRSPSGALLGVTLERPDGTKTVLTQGTADKQGRPVTVVSQDGAVDDLKYDGAGREVVRTSTRSGGEKATVTRTYDGAGRLLKLEGDKQRAGGSEKEVRVAKYDSKGQMTSLAVSSTRVDGGHTSSQASEITFTWDGAGRLVGEKEKLGGGDGQHGFNLEAETRYEYDAKGRLTRIVSHAAGYPPIDRTITTTYSY